MQPGRSCNWNERAGSQGNRGSQGTTRFGPCFLHREISSMQLQDAKPSDDTALPGEGQAFHAGTYRPGPPALSPSGILGCVVHEWPSVKEFLALAGLRVWREGSELKECLSFGRAPVQQGIPIALEFCANGSAGTVLAMRLDSRATLPLWLIHHRKHRSRPPTVKVPVFPQISTLNPTPLLNSLKQHSGTIVHIKRPRCICSLPKTRNVMWLPEPGTPAACTWRFWSSDDSLALFGDPSPRRGGP